MKKAKLLILFVFVILLSGCKGEYNLELKKDMSIKENVVLYVDNVGDTYNKTIKLFEENNIDNSKYKINKNDEYVIVHYNNDYDSIEDYILNSIFYSRLLSGEEYNKDNKSISYKTFINLKLDDNGTSSNLNNSFYITKLKINLTIPFLIKENNADKINGNTLTWNLSEKDSYKTINFSFNYLKNNNLYIIIIMLCIFIIGVPTSIIIYNYLKQNRL